MTQGFSVIRTVALAIPLLMIAVIVVQITDLYGASSGDLTILNRPHLPGVPSSIVVGLFVPLLLLSAAVPALRRRWHITRGELVVVYCMLFIAAPVLGPAFWLRFPGLQLEYARKLRLPETMSISSNLWPHGENLLGGAIEVGHLGSAVWSTDNSRTTTLADAPDGSGRCFKIEHLSPRDATRVTMTLNRATAERFVNPARRYAIGARLRLDEPGSMSAATILAGTDPDRLAPLAPSSIDAAGGSSVVTATAPRVLAPTRFVMSGAVNFEVPSDLDDRFHVVLSCSGSGTFYARDFFVMETEDVFRYFEGYEQASSEVFGKLPRADRAVVVQRSDDAWGRWGYLIAGRVPWRSWARPLLVWGLLVAGMLLAMFCLVTLFYGQWEDRDRLSFPLANFVLDLTAGDDAGRLVILRSKPFWIGFAACGLYLFMQQMNTYYPEVPAVRLSLSVPGLLADGPIKSAVSSVGAGSTSITKSWVGYARGGLTIDVRPAFVAVAFLMSLEMSLSLVSFFLVGLLLRLVAAFTPLRSFRPGGDHYDVGGFPFDSLLTTGGLLFVGCFCVFSARRHLVNVTRAVFRGGAPNGEQDGPGRYRRAVLGLIAAVALLLCFGVAAELNLLFLVFYLGTYLVLALSAARIRAETGLPHLSLLPVYPQYYLFAVGGVAAMAFPEIVFTSQSAFLYLGGFLMLCPVLAESMAAATRSGVPLGKLKRCLATALVLAIVLGGIVHLTWAYTVGSSNLHPALANAHAPYANCQGNFKKMDRRIDAYFRDDLDRPAVITPEDAGEIAPFLGRVFVITGASFLVTGLLTLARVVWLGFPLHPLGFALAFSPAIYALWPSIAVGHIVKRAGLRFGGLPLVRGVLRPFFVGLFVADLLSLTVWRVVESVV
ncbi:MAG: hypothetical protein CMJ18_25915 [Phycisphaeraceae bacterium]|nr:hypothetical protein [Phycisphaeraceae bacterium]